MKDENRRIPLLDNPAPAFPLGKPILRERANAVNVRHSSRQYTTRQMAQSEPLARHRENCSR